MSSSKKYAIPARFLPKAKVVVEEKILEEKIPGEIQELKALGVEAYYFENFFTKEEADVYYTALLADYPFHQEQIKFAGTVHDQPRLTRFMGEEGKTYYYSGYNRTAVGWIPSALEIRDKIMSTILAIRPNHPLLTTNLGNLYRNGHDYVADHSDDETDLNRDAFIASISLGAERDFDLKIKGSKERVLRINLKHGSLFLMGKNFQKNLIHGIPKRLRVKDPRLNLTFRALGDK